MVNINWKKAKNWAHRSFLAQLSNDCFVGMSAQSLRDHDSSVLFLGCLCTSDEDNLGIN